MHNPKYSEAERTEIYIDKIQKYLFETGIYFSSSLDIPVSTKIHLMIYHLSDYIIHSGLSRRIDTYQNETMHKSKKAAYSETAYKVSEISQ